MKYMLKRILYIIVAAFMVLQVQAQGQAPGKPERFDPNRFEADLEQFITTDAGLNPYQASKFFPLYREMQKKQRALFNKMRYYQHVDFRDNKASEKAIKECDFIDLEIKGLQQEYHKKFCKVLPAGLVLKIIKADEKFHRQAFQKVAKHNRR